MTYAPRGIRKPTINDAPGIKRLLLDFKKASPYADFSMDESTVEGHIEEFLAAPVSEKLILVSDDKDGKVCGVIVGAVVPFWWNKHEKHAAELAWWVDPENRKGRIGLYLKSAMEYWGWRVGCTHVHFSLVETDQTERLHKFYVKNGFKQVEKAYIKELRE